MNLLISPSGSERTVSQTFTSGSFSAEAEATRAMSHSLGQPANSPWLLLTRVDNRELQRKFDLARCPRCRAELVFVSFGQFLKADFGEWIRSINQLPDKSDALLEKLIHENNPPA